MSDEGIIGGYLDSSNVWRNFIGTPVAETPEPASLGLLGVGVLGAVLRRRNR